MHGVSCYLLGNAAQGADASDGGPHRDGGSLKIRLGHGGRKAEPDRSLGNLGSDAEGEQHGRRCVGSRSAGRAAGAQHTLALQLQEHGLESVEREVRWLTELIETERRSTTARPLSSAPADLPHPPTPERGAP